MTNDRVKEMAYIALYAALCMVLQIVSDLIPFLQMPQGGSIELGFAALFVAAYHLGWKDGLIVGALWWVIGLLFGKNAWYLNPLQYAFDYLLPIAAVAMGPLYWRKKGQYIPGVVIGMVLKYICNLISGVYFWPPEGGAAGSTAAWVYSMNYNAWYNLATMILSVILVPLLISKIRGAVKMNQ